MSTDTASESGNTAPQEHTVCVDAQTLLAIAQVLQHVQSLRELDEARLTVPLADGKTGSMGGRAGLAVLKRILTLRRMVAKKTAEAKKPATKKPAAKKKSKE